MPVSISSPLHFVNDVGMFAWDRSRKSCAHRTKFCSANCYNKKLYKTFPNMATQESKLEFVWDHMDYGNIASQMRRARKQTKRVRGCTRGENFNNCNDVIKVYYVALVNPDTVFWLPTRAWRNEELKQHIEKTIMKLPNARVQASMDPSNTLAEWHMVVDAGWSTLFFGDNDMTVTPTGHNMIKCQKTHKGLNKGLKGVCATCKRGCFSANQNHVHLKQH